MEMFRHPQRPDRIFVVQHESPTILHGESLDGEWYCFVKPKDPNVTIKRFFPLET